MTRIASVLALLLLSSSAVAAPRGGRGGHPGGHEPGEGAQKLVEALDLRPAQVERVRAILADARANGRPRMERLRDDLGDLKAARSTGAGVTAKVRRLVRKVALDRAELLILKMEAMDAVRAELTPEQVRKLDELKGQRGSDEELRDGDREP